MSTVLTHPAIPLAIGLGLGRNVVPGRLLAAGVLASVLPDLDTIGYRLGVPYDSLFGHRGFSHSILFALLLAMAGALAYRKLNTTAFRAFLFLLLAAASHPFIDAFTNGGLGVLAFWPFSGNRYFAPFQVIEVAPIGIFQLVSKRGAVVLLSELKWVWQPCFYLMVTLMCVSRYFSGLFGGAASEA
ncbi:MAG: metal-dependent hydrolase [Deltaproteobacteria bacterium]|nr:metal-dependent hydrolase [Deltaproteobacteria bacterium]